MDGRSIRETWGPRMRRDWTNAPTPTLSTTRPGKSDTNGTPDEFFESGERDCQLFVDPIIKKLGLEPGLCDAGVGVWGGRMTKALSRRFRSVRATDVSPEMVSKANPSAPS